MLKHRHEHREELVDRLSKVEGHIRGIKKMLSAGQPCDQVLMQLSAVRAALKKATQILLEDHFDHCVMEKNTNKELGKELAGFRKILDGFLI